MDDMNLNTRQLRSILKKPVSAPSDASSQHEGNRQLALHHANILQQRKDMEHVVLTQIEALIELPTSPHADPAQPSAADIEFVCAALQPFQPSDFDDLITERNANNTCGYVLCPHPKRVEPAKNRILRDKSTGHGSLRFVTKEEMEMWCSDQCEKRAVYVKAQLHQEPAWTRQQGISVKISIPGGKSQDEDENGSDSLASNLQNLSISPDSTSLSIDLRSVAISPNSSPLSKDLQDMSINR